MGNITLSKIVIAGLVGTLMIFLLLGAYSTFAITNNSTIDEKYSSALQTISNQYNGLNNSFGSTSINGSNEGTVKNILGFGKNAVSSTINVFVVGLDAIGSLFEVIPIIGTIVNVITDAIPGFSGLLGLLTIIIGFYIAMRYIQSTSNKTDLP